MIISPIIQNILSHYETDNTETLTNLSRILMHGALGGTGKLLILPVDQGFEHGPDKSFSQNPEAYDPHYHYQLAVDASLSAYAAPLGMLECGAKTFAGKIPTILKMNNSNSLLPKNNEPDQAMTASIDDAIRLGCAAVGLTIYPGSEKSLEMFEEASCIIREAKFKGLPTVIWAYPRGGDLSKSDEISLETISYSAHIAALLGAHIIKVKMPTGNDIKHVVKSCFSGKRIVVFSGGVVKSNDELLSQARIIKAGGGNGSIIGRNSFQRPKTEAIKLLHEICEIYKQ
jgi:class I fructose-bisphosphate aldolase